LAVSEQNGKVFGWGQGMQGRLGNGSQQVVPEPIEIQNFHEISSEGRKVKSVSCGENHSLAIIQDNQQSELYVWGNNDKFQLGFEGESQVHSPKKN